MENDNRNQATRDASDKQASKEATGQKFIYKKRPGTSGVTGQLYETKLLSLVLLRALNDEHIKEFYLGNNIDNIGAFDDICIQFKLENLCVAAFIQAKHKDDPRKGSITDEDLWNKKGDFSLHTYFDSFIKIKQKFETSKLNNGQKKVDKMFSESYKDVECYFIIYTPVTGKLSRKKNIQSNRNVNKIRNLLTTCDNEELFQLTFDNNDVISLAFCLIEEQMNLIANALLECVVTDINNAKHSNETREIIKKYYDFLIPNVLEVCCKEGVSYEVKINPKLLYSNCSLCIKLREIIFESILSDDLVTFEDKQLEYNLMTFLTSNNCDTKTLSKIIGKVVVMNRKTNTLDLKSTVPGYFERYRNRLKKTQISYAELTEALHEAGKEKILLLRFKLPPTVNTSRPTVTAAKIEGVSGDSTELIDPVLSDADLFCEQKNMARQFLQQLYFYTKEAKQDQVEEVITKEIYQCNGNILSKNYLSTSYSKAIFLKLHDKVQKWSMLQGNVYYLTHCCDFLEESRREIIGTPYLTTLNFNYTSELKKYDIQFKNETVEKLQLDSMPSGVTTIVSNAKALTCIKLCQWLKGVLYAFLDIQSTLMLTSNEIKTLLEEIQSTETGVLVIICGTGKDNIPKLVTQIIELFTNKVIVVTDLKESKNKNTRLYTNVIIDLDNSLADLTIETQNQLLDSNKMVIQGVEVPLNEMINNEIKHLISGDPLMELIKTECIAVGKTLIDSKYESIKEYYMPRSLNKKREYDSPITCITNHFYDILNSVVVLIAEPGMGKSTLITHLSLETKIKFPNIWIVRINLLDHCTEFLKWQKERRKIDIKDTMTLVCKAELNNMEGTFDLEFTDDVMSLKNCDIEGISLLNLELLINCYNNGTIIFLFDGFDEICPHYEKEVVTFIKNVIPESDKHINESGDSDDNDSCFEGLFLGNIENSEDEYVTSSDEIDHMVQKNEKHSYFPTNKSRKRIWITSRPYNSIKHILERKFGTSYQLKPLSAEYQNRFYYKYLDVKIKLHELNAEQFRNIEEFFEYMSQFRRKFGEFKLLHITSIPLHCVFAVAVDYFRNSILSAPLKVDKEKLRNDWVSKDELLSIFERCLGNLTELAKALLLAGIPLHMHIAANYFVNEIKTTVDKSTCYKWDLSVNTFAYFESFLETKFKVIRLEEKNRRYTSCPDERLAYEREKKEFMEGHKTLAFYALFHRHNAFRRLMSKRTYSQMREMIRKIKQGEEKTGLIHKIHNKVPRFIHLVFAEYFAFEFIADMLKISGRQIKRRVIGFLIYTLLLEGPVGIMTVFDHKLLHDEDFRNALSDSENKKLVFELLLDQNGMTEDHYDDNSDMFYEKKIETSLCRTIRYGLFNVVMFLLSSLEGNLTEDNLATFLELIGKYFFVTAALLSRDDVVVYLLNQIRNIEHTVVCNAISRSELPYYFRPSPEGILPTNDDIVASLHSHGKELVTPRSYYDEDFHEFRNAY